MMSTNKRTEDFIKEKLDSREFAFDESAWAEAEMLIEAQGAGNARRILLWVFSANVLIGLVALFAWLMPMGNNQSDTNTLANKGNTTTENAIALNEQKTDVAETTIENTAKPTAETFAKPARETNKPANAKKVKAESAETTPQTSGNTANKVAYQPGVGAAKTSVKSNGENKQDNDDHKPTSNVVSPQPSAAQNNNNEGVAEPQLGNEPSSLSNADKQPEEFKDPASAEEKGLALNADKTQEEAPIVPEAVKVAPIVIATEETKKASETGAVAVEVKVEVDRQVAMAKANSEGKETSKSTGESSSNNRKNKFAWPPQIPKPQPPAKGGRNSWGVIAGISVWDPYASTLGARSWNGVVGATAGLSYERALTKRIWFGTNAIYWSRGALNFNHVINETTGNVGDPEYVNNKTILTPSVSHIFNLPLYVKFDISRRHHALIGASGSYLMATTYESRKLKETATGTQDLGTRKITGQHPGFYKYDVMMMFGYEYSITDRLMAGTRFNYGFYDRTKNTYQNITSYDKNINLEFTLRYDFLRH